MTDGALLETIVTATEAKADALRSMGHSFTGTPTDEVVVSFEGEVRHEYAGTLTDLGKRVYEAVRFGVMEALKRHTGEIARERPSLFVYSRFGGEHWTEWLPENCPYYPCHFEGQACDFCYCPFYPCGDETLGEPMTSSTNGIVWNCSRCTLLHEPDVASYLKKHPGATLTELKRVRRKGKLS
jgi:adenosylcobinamide hydrolase